jgi:hypothetical protein
MKIPYGKPWFGFYRFGLGYGPITWQGWIVTVVMVVGIVLVAHLFHP